MYCVHMCSKTGQCNPILIDKFCSNQDLYLADVDLMMAGQIELHHYTNKNTSYFRHFCLCPCINFSLSHAVFTFVLSQYPTVNFTRFHSLCPKKSHYCCALFNSGAFLQQCPCLFDLCLNETKGREPCCACSNYLSAT